MEKIVLGSIYSAGKVQKPGFACGGSGDISFGNTIYGKELQWVKLKSGLLIADRSVCTSISWEQLNKNGFVFGTPIVIDGKTYWCRCLRIGPTEDEPNEWDTVLDEVGEDNDLWHWNDIYFWGQETSEFDASTRAVRGYPSARYWHDSGAADRGVAVGFRPALEPLGSVPCSPDSLLDKKTRVYCPEGVTIEARLVDFSEYDVVLEASSPMVADCSWTMKDGRNLIVSRENVPWLKEV